MFTPTANGSRLANLFVLRHRGRFLNCIVFVTMYLVDAAFAAFVDNANKSYATFMEHSTKNPVHRPIVLSAYTLNNHIDVIVLYIHVVVLCCFSNQMYSRTSGRFFSYPISFCGLRDPNITSPDATSHKIPDAIVICTPSPVVHLIGFPLASGTG